jgi:hypothetical protein
VEGDKNVREKEWKEKGKEGNTCCTEVEMLEGTRENTFTFVLGNGGKTSTPAPMTSQEISNIDICGNVPTRITSSLHLILK